MTVAEASDVQTVLRWALSVQRPGSGHVSDLEASQAARRLADRAYRQLGTGILPRDADLDRTAVAAALTRAHARIADDQRRAAGQQGHLL